MIEVTIEGGEAAADHLASFADRLRRRLTTLTQRLAGDLQARVLDNLHGGALQERSGRLANALTLGMDAGGGRLSARLDVESGSVPYAAFQEYGFRGTETVRSHLRTIKQAFGRPIAARQVFIGSYTRKVDYPAHSFLRSALDELAPDIAPQIRDAIDAEASDQ